MDSKILLGKILQRFEDRGYVKIADYNRFGRVKEGASHLEVLRENNNTARVDFKKLLVAIEFYQSHPEAYDEGPSELRRAGLTHVTSPIFSLLHLLSKEAYGN
jgi:hypothetical protein